MRRRTWKTKRTRERTSSRRQAGKGDGMKRNGRRLGMGLRLRLWWVGTWLGMGWDGPRTRLPSLITILINLFKWEKRAQYGNDSWGRADALARQLKAEWLYDISRCRLRRSWSLVNFIVPLQCPLLLLSLSFSSLSYAPSSHCTATCGINYAAIMSCFVAKSFGFFLWKCQNKLHYFSIRGSMGNARVAWVLCLCIAMSVGDTLDI